MNKAIVMMQVEIDTDPFMDLLPWFIKNLVYPEVNHPDGCPNPVIVLQEDDNENSTDTSVDNVECRIPGKDIFCREAQDMIQHNAVFDNS